MKWPVFAIQKAFKQGAMPAEAMLGDGTNLRFKLGRDDTGWLQPSTFAPLAEGYQPRVVISIDLAWLRKCSWPGAGLFVVVGHSFRHPLAYLPNVDRMELYPRWGE